MIEFANKKKRESGVPCDCRRSSSSVLSPLLCGVPVSQGGSGGTTDSAIGKVNYNQLVQAVPGIQDAQVENAESCPGC